MPYLELIPERLLLPQHRDEFLSWLRSMPLEFFDRLRIYFAYLDYNHTYYTPDEIDSLKPLKVDNATTTAD